MKNQATGSALFGFKIEGGARQAELSSFPLVQRLIKSFMPELLDGSVRSLLLQRRVLEYLFERSNQGAPYLKNHLNEPLFIALSGLKSTLRQAPNMNVLTLAMEEHKRRFIQRIFDEE
jgi:hypothetical protein